MIDVPCPAVLQELGGCETRDSRAGSFRSLLKARLTVLYSLDDCNPSIIALLFD